MRQYRAAVHVTDKFTEKLSFELYTWAFEIKKSVFTDDIVFLRSVNDFF